MSSIEQLNDFAEAWVGSNLLDRCVEEVRGSSMGSSEVIFNAVLFRPHGWWVVLRSQEIGLPSVGYDTQCAMITTTIGGVLIVWTTQMEIVWEPYLIIQNSLFSFVYQIRC